MTRRPGADASLDLVLVGTPAAGLRVAHGARLRASDVTVVDSNTGMHVFDRSRAKVAGSRLVENSTGIRISDSRVELIDTRLRGGGDGIDSTSSHVTPRRTTSREARS